MTDEAKKTAEQQELEIKLAKEAEAEAEAGAGAGAEELAKNFLRKTLPYTRTYIVNEQYYLNNYLTRAGLDTISLTEKNEKLLTDDQKGTYKDLVLCIVKSQTHDATTYPSIEVLLNNAFNSFSKSMGAKNKTEAYTLLLKITKDLKIDENSNLFGLTDIITHYTQSDQLDNILKQFSEFQGPEELCRELAYQYEKKPSSSFDFVCTMGPNKGHTFDVQKFNVDSTVSPVAKERARGMFLIPKKTEHFDENIPLWFTWTGTNSKESATADMTEVNAGEHSYRLLEAPFMTQSLGAIHEAKKRFPGKKIELHFTGHSLGGALCQLHFASMQRVLAQCLALQSSDSVKMNDFINKDKAYLENLTQGRSIKGVGTETLKEIAQCYIDNNLRAKDDIASLDLHPWNSTGVTQPVADYTKALMEKNKLAGITSKAEYVIFPGDPIHLTGKANVFDDPSTQDITILEITTKRHATENTNLATQTVTTIMPVGAGAVGASLAAPLGPVGMGAGFLLGAGLGYLFRAKEGVGKHTGRLTNTETGVKKEEEQAYRFLKSSTNPEEIKQHLLLDKSCFLETVKNYFQPILFSNITEVQPTDLISAIMANTEKVDALLEAFVENRTNATSIKKISESEQMDLLTAMQNNNPKLLEKMDRLFLQAGPEKDMDAIFDKKTLIDFMSQHIQNKSFLFDRVLSKIEPEEKNKIYQELLKKYVAETPPKNEAIINMITKKQLKATDSLAAVTAQITSYSGYLYNSSVPPELKALQKTLTSLSEVESKSSVDSSGPVKIHTPKP